MADRAKHSYEGTEAYEHGYVKGRVDALTELIRETFRIIQEENLRGGYAMILAYKNLINQKIGE